MNVSIGSGCGRRAVADDDGRFSTVAHARWDMRPSDFDDVVVVIIIVAVEERLGPTLDWGRAEVDESWYLFLRFDIGRVGRSSRYGIIRVDRVEDLRVGAV